jgi:hypothetical protein
MTPVNGDIDQILRSALHAEVDSIEPGDGLERIRRRTHAPWLVRQASLMLTECVDLAQLIVIRLEPAITSVRTTVGERGGPWEAFVGLLSSAVASIAALFMPPSRRRTATHRSPRSNSNLGWLRPALAVAGAVVIVVAGVYGLAQVRDNLVLELFPSGTPASHGPSNPGNGGQAPTLNGQTAPTGIVPSGGQTGSAQPSPRTSCSSTPKAQATTTAPATAVPTPTDSPSPAPTDSSAPSPTASPTDTTSTSAVSLGSSGIRTVANIALATCGSASPSKSS